MKANNLSNLVVIRNHIVALMDNSNIVDKTSYRALNEKRIDLDKKFVQIVKSLNVDDFVSDIGVVLSDGVAAKTVDSEENKPVVVIAPNEPSVSAKAIPAPVEKPKRRYTKKSTSKKGA